MTHPDRLLVAAVVACLAGDVVVADDSIRWKFRAGDSFFVTEKTTRSDRYEIDGREMTAEHRSDGVLQFGVLRADPGQLVVLNALWLRLDTVGAGPGAPQSRLAEVLKRTPFQLSLDSAGNIARIGGYRDFAQITGAGGESGVRLPEPVLSEPWLLAALGRSFSVSHRTDVKQNDSWQKTGLLPLGSLGTLRRDHMFTHAGRDEDSPIVRINVRTTGRYVARQPGPGMEPAAIHIADADLKCHNIDGSAEFNTETGRLVRMTSGFRLAGAATITIRDRPHRVTLDSTQTVTVAVHDQSPLTDDIPPGAR